MKITCSVGYEVAVLAIPRCLTRIAVETLKAIPRFTTVLGELRDAVRHIERLVTFAAQELPEVIYQLETIRGQLAAIERRLGVEAGSLSPDEPRTG